MDEALVANWNSVVGLTDTVYLLGDVSFHRTARTLELLVKLRGFIALIRGNHDKRLSSEITARFMFVKDLYTLQVDDVSVSGKRPGQQDIILCHYALRTWEKSHYGAWNLYGHSHGNLTDDPHVRAIDVGVDCHNYHPISYEQVKAIMLRKQVRAIDGQPEENM